MSSTYRIDVQPRRSASDPHLVAEARAAGFGELTEILAGSYYLLRGDLDERGARRLAETLLADGITEESSFSPSQVEGYTVVEVQKKPGVMDPWESTIRKGAADLGLQLSAVRVGRRYQIAGADPQRARQFAFRSLANQAIEEVAVNPSEPVRLPLPGGEVRHPRTELPIDGLDDEGLMKLSREGCLSLNLAEMQTIRDHFAALGRHPTDIELESLAQTWSEHCVHKTFKGIVAYHGPDGERTIDNLLKETIAKATAEIDAPWCLSVFIDNSGVIAFDQEYGVCLKVETHNHPSAIEPYGGANTGMGGVIRDIIGTGLGAKPIFGTNVFCFGHLDTPQDELPPGTIHPRHLMRRVVAGVRDYGNRMGIPTVNGCVRFDDRYIGNPLVFCGTGGLIPRAAIGGEAAIGDHIVVIGGRTGRDGIHGATFSSIELSSDSELVSSGAVQIGNAIEEKKVLDTMLQARDAGCFTAVTDCGAGGISSAIGEMGERLGVEVHLDRAPLKYAGLTYTEIWISEAQERMVAAVPPDKLKQALAIFAAENVEATDLGTFTGDGRLRLFYHGEEVCDLAMSFLHDGLPRLRRTAVFTPVEETRLAVPRSADLAEDLKAVLARPNVASKEWVIRQYDHEVQAGSIIKPLVGVGRDGPSDGAVVAPLLGRDRGVGIACGLNTCFGDVDAYHAAAAGIEEALRNLVCIGAPLSKVAILDNFSWGNCDKPENLGQLVRACEACYDLATFFRTPFISGKDSLNNEFVHGGQTIVIPPTLLITAMTVIDDVTRCISMDVKEAGDAVVILGTTQHELGGSEYLAHLGMSGDVVPKWVAADSRLVLEGAVRVIAAGLANAAHDCSDGGLAVTLAEMAFAGGLGMEIEAEQAPRGEAVGGLETLLFSESLSRIVLTVPAARLAEAEKLLAGVPHARIGTVIAEGILRVRGLGSGFTADLAELKAAWQSGLSILVG